MAEPRAQRTLVNSPPELWAEVSDVTALARHLGVFGEIRIPRLEPDTTVAWEGATARGTVELQASGWGTKVTLTAELTGPPPVAEPEPVAVEPEPEPEPEPVAVEPASVPSHGDAQDEGPLTAPEPVAAEPVAAEPEPEPEPEKLGFFARLFGRKPKPVAPREPVAVAVMPEPPAAKAASVPSHGHAQDEGPLTTPEPVPVVPEPEPVAVELEPEPAPELVPDDPDAPEGELRTGEPVAERAVDHDTAVAVLTAVLDDLGAAHHRPFSRS
jgi:hypothetical protein